MQRNFLPSVLLFFLLLIFSLSYLIGFHLTKNTPSLSGRAEKEEQNVLDNNGNTDSLVLNRILLHIPSNSNSVLEDSIYSINNSIDRLLTSDSITNNQVQNFNQENTKIIQKNLSSVYGNNVFNSKDIIPTHILPGNFIFKINPDFRPVIDQIKEAVTKTEKNGFSIHYKKSNDYINSKSFANIAFRAALVQPLNFNIGTKLSNGIDSLYKESNKAGNIIFGSENTVNNCFDIVRFTNGSLSKKIISILPTIKIDSNHWIYRQDFEKIDTKTKEEFNKFVFFINKTTGNNQNPISISDILTYLLESNNGDLAESLWDTAISLKLLSRNDVNNGCLYLHNRMDPNYFVTNIKDEFNLLSNYRDIYAEYGSFNENPDISTINLIGTPYHYYYPVAMLDTFPSQVLSILTMMRYSGYYSDEGLQKALNDLYNVSSLEQIESYLNSFPQS